VWRRLRGLPRIAQISAAVAVVAILLVIWLAGSAPAAPTALAVVVRGPLVIGVTESGMIQNREQVVVKSQVEGTTTILWLISEGANVKAGDPLVDLDSSKLQDDRAQQAILVMNDEAAYIKARETVVITESQGQTDVAKADLDLKLAQRDLTMYLEGQYVNDRAKCDADIQLSKEALQRAKDKLDWSSKLAGEGYITQTELEADKSAFSKANIDLQLADGNLSLLEKHTRPRTVQKLQSDVEQAVRALDRTKEKATSDMLQAQADKKAKESEYNRQQDRLAKIDERIEKCHIVAPVEGMAVYATTGRANWRGNEEPLAEGQAVRERQELIYLPTTTRMMAQIKVHESALRKVKIGLPVRISVDAMPGQTFWGRVSKIGLLPDAQSAWMNPDLKVYATDIEVTSDTNLMRAGMSCRAEIIVDQYPDALQVPVQSVVRVAGKTVVYMPTPDGPQLQPITVGMDNGQWVHVLAGLSEGQRVLLAPPLEHSTVAEDTTVDVPASHPASLPVLALTAAEESAASQPEEQQEVNLATEETIRKLVLMKPEQRRAYFENMSEQECNDFFAKLTAPQQARLRQLVGVKLGHAETDAPNATQPASRPSADAAPARALRMGV
jgi:HlyD family secretion protein